MDVQEIKHLFQDPDFRDLWAVADERTRNEFLEKRVNKFTNDVAEFTGAHHGDVKVNALRNGHGNYDIDYPVSGDHLHGQHPEA